MRQGGVIGLLKRQNLRIMLGSKIASEEVKTSTSPPLADAEAPLGERASTLSDHCTMRLSASSKEEPCGIGSPIPLLSFEGQGHVENLNSLLNFSFRSSVDALGDLVNWSGLRPRCQPPHFPWKKLGSRQLDPEICCGLTLNPLFGLYPQLLLSDARTSVDAKGDLNGVKNISHMRNTLRTQCGCPLCLRSVAWKQWPDALQIKHGSLNDRWLLIGEAEPSPLPWSGPAGPAPTFWAVCGF